MGRGGLRGRPSTPGRTALLLFWGAQLAAFLAVAIVMLGDPARCLSDDSLEYLGLARTLSLEQRFFSHYHPGLPELYRTPLYPLWISWLRAWESLGALRLLLATQMAMGLGAAVAIALTARAAGGRDSWWTGALYLASPVVLVNTLTVGTEPLFVLLASLGALLLVRGLRACSWRTMAGSGLLVGLSCLARPIGVVLLVIGVVVCAVRLARGANAGGPRRLAAAWLTAACLLPGAWSVRNGLAGGFWGPSRTLISFPSSVLGSQYLDHGQEPMKTSAYDAQGLEAGVRDLSGAVARHPLRALRTVAVGSARTLLGPGEWTLRRALLGDVGFRDPREGTGVYVIDATGPALRFFETPGASPTASSRGRSAACWALLAWSVAAMGIVYLRALRGVPTLRGLRALRGLGAAGPPRALHGAGRGLPLLWLAAAVGLTLASAGFLSNSRFRLPVLPFVLLLGGGPVEPKKRPTAR